MKTLFLTIAVLSVILSFKFYLFYSNKKSYSINEKVSIEHTFWQEPRVTFYSQSFYIEEILVNLPYKYPQYSYGDRVRVTGVLKEKTYLSKREDRVIKVLYLDNPRIQILEKKLYFQAAQQVREKIISSFQAYLPSRQAGMSLGIVLGLKEGIDKDMYEQMKKTGVVHVIAASGANVSIMSAFLLTVINTLVRRKLALIFTSFVIIFYALISGFDPPIVRASIMALTAFCAQIIGRQNTPILALLLSVFIMLFLNPLLILDIGFQLSFLSTAGILYIKPIIDRFSKTAYLSFLKDDFSTTLSAQVVTLPIILHNFSSYSAISIIANLSVLWTIPILMVLGIISAFFSLFLPILAAPFLYLSYPLLWYFEHAVSFFQRFSFPIEVGGFSIYLIFAYYCFVLAFVLKKKNPISSRKKHE